MQFFASPTFGFLLKISAAVAALVFGVFGFGRISRDATGRLTRYGRLALGGIVIAGLLAVGTNVYEFFKAQQSQQAELGRARRLLSTVEYGLYPLRGATVAFGVTLNRNSAIFSRSIRAIRWRISKDRWCKSRTFVCRGFSRGVPYVYSIGYRSPLFPKSSALRALLDDMTLSVRLYALAPGTSRESRGADTLRYLGGFGVYWRSVPSDALLNYDYTDNRLYFAENHFVVSDSVLRESGIYSIIEAFPGLVTISKDIDEDTLCSHGPFRKLDDDACQQMALQMKSATSLTFADISFLFPKRIDFFSAWSTRCSGRDAPDRVSEMPDDIDLLDENGDVGGDVSESSLQRNCRLIDSLVHRPYPSTSSAVRL